MPSLARSVSKPLKVPSLARSLPKPLNMPSLARSVHKLLKVPSLARDVLKPTFLRCRPPTQLVVDSEGHRRYDSPS